MKEIICTTCKGDGYISIMPGSMRSLRMCPFCKGTGNTLVDGIKQGVLITGCYQPDLTGNEYQKLAARTMDKKLSPIDQSTHALFGMVGEIGEIHSLYQKAYQGHSFDFVHAKKEVGDLLWFIAEYCTANGWKLSDVMAENITKLEDRYPDGFDSDRSVNREEYAKLEEKKKELTYDDIFAKCLDEYEISGAVSYYRPYEHINDAIIIYLKDGRKVLYFYDGKSGTFKYIK